MLDICALKPRAACPEAWASSTEGTEGSMLFDDIELLIVLSEAKSLSQAADQLYMSRPGLSQRIAQMEKRFGTPLYRRTSIGIEITKAGEYVTAFARNTAKLERVLASQLAAIEERFDSTLEVGMSMNDGVALLPRLVAQYVEEDPSARVHLDAGYEPQLVAQLQSADLDLALLENQPDVPGIVNEVLGYKRLVFVAPNRAPYNQLTNPASIEMLLTWPMIIYEWDSGRHMVGNRHFRERYGVSLSDHNMIACFDTHEAMMEGVKAGLGWGTVPECIYRRYKGDEDVIRLKVNTAPMWYPVSLAWSSEHVQTDAAREFLDFIRAHIPEGYFRTDTQALINS